MKCFRIPLWLRLALALGIALFGVAAMSITARLSTLNRLQQVRSDYHQLSKAMASLGMDNCGTFYPDDTHLRRELDPTLPLTFEWMPIQKRQGMVLKGFRCLNSTYIKSMPTDPFNPGHNYGYTALRCENSKRNGLNNIGILSSPGPDGKIDCPLEDLREQIGHDLEITHSRELNLSTEDHGRIQQRITPYLYDPTNGTRSRGDLIMVEVAHQIRHGFTWEPRPAEDWVKLAHLENTTPTAIQGFRQQVPRVPLTPEPPLSEEARSYLPPISLPIELLDIFQSADVFNQQSRSIDPARVDRLKNHLGDFRTFFEQPVLDAASQNQPGLEAWRREDPQWWQAMAKRCTGVFFIKGKKVNGWSTQYLGYLNAYDVYPIIVLYGKSQILQAADEAGHNKPDLALARIGSLRRIITDDHIGGSVALIKLDDTIARIHQELGRLCYELETDIRLDKRIREVIATRQTTTKEAKTTAP